jgi:hypothetical protein
VKVLQYFGVALGVVTVIVAVVIVWVFLPHESWLSEARESQTISALVSPPISRDEIVAYLNSKRVDWHWGACFENGNAYSSFQIPCRTASRHELQASFTHFWRFCEEFGDVVTVRFTKNGKVKSWQVYSAVDGC